MDDAKIIAGHLKDLADRSYSKGIYTFSNFLGEAAQGILSSLSGELSYAGIEISGGRDYADRVVVRFGSEEQLGYVQEFPITCLCASPSSRKFSEVLTHRDFLGALMGLGIERELLGDIIVRENAAYIFCIDHISDYIKDNLTQVRHTAVDVQPVLSVPEDARQQFREMTVIASSARLDAIVSKIFNMSRNTGQRLFSEGKVFVNGSECTSASFSPKPGDTVSVRGFGKFIFDGEAGATGKGRLRLLARIMI